MRRFPHQALPGSLNGDDSRPWVSASALAHLDALESNEAENVPKLQFLRGVVKMPAKELKVLVVDDEPTIADTLAVILRQSGFETHTAYSGEGAVRLSVQIKPDLMISDVMMPDKNGIDVASEVQALVPKCRVLFFSGQCNTAALLIKAKQSGKHWEVLPKPVHPKDLLARVRDVVHGESNEITSASNGRARPSSGEPSERSSDPEVITVAATTSIGPGKPKVK